MARGDGVGRKSPARGRRAARARTSSAMPIALGIAAFGGIVVAVIFMYGGGGRAPVKAAQPAAMPREAAAAERAPAQREPTADLLTVESEPEPEPIFESAPVPQILPSPTPAAAPPVEHHVDETLTYVESDEGGERSADTMNYVGGEGNQRFECVKELSDGTVLIGGGASDMRWIPQDAERISIDTGRVEGGAGDSVGFILHVSKDLMRVLTVVEFAGGKARNISRIKSTEMPGADTGALYVSGARAPLASGKKKDGYFIARLDRNFVDGRPSRFEWVKTVWAEGEVANNHPWDVGGDGKVVFVTGAPHGYDWLAVHRLTAAGEMDIVPEWRLHWYERPDGKGGEWFGSPASGCPEGDVTHSGIVLKVWGRGDFRSWTSEEYSAKSSDGNGGTKQGAWPYDLMFEGPFNPKDPGASPRGRGYTGYGWPSTPCGNCSAVAIDRRNNHIYLGGNNKSSLPGGNPDFEPYVIAFTDTGKKKWWQRLYQEAKGVSTPDQYCDGLAIDYTKSCAQGSLIALARCHGNNVVNLWAGDSIARASVRGFQKSFTGTHGNMHIQWLGRMTLAGGEMLCCTYVAEYAEDAKVGSDAWAEPIMDGWPRFDSGWPNLNTTRVEPQFSVDGMGNVYVCGLGRRVVTTANAYLKMPNPLRDVDAKGQWSDFVRVYDRNLSMPRYSSLVKGKWDWKTGEGGSDVDVRQCIPVSGGLLLVGYSSVDRKTKQVAGDDMATPKLLPWGKKSRTGEMGVFGKLHFRKR